MRSQALRDDYGTKDTLAGWMAKRRMNPSQCKWWLERNGLGITVEYVRDVASGKKQAGPYLTAAFRSITGVTLVRGKL